MSSKNAFRPVTVAPMGTPCGWWMYGETGHKHTCGSGYMAIHILTETLPVAKAGTALCGFHSPFDPTEAEREAVGQPFQTMGEAGAARLAKVYADRIAHVKATETVGPEMPLATWEQEVSGVEILADMLTLSPVAEAVPFAARVIKFHKLSAPMIGVLTEVARSRGLVGAWAMRNVVVRGVDRATMRTVAALRVRGLIDAQTNDGNQSGTGGLTDYVLTEAGYSVAEAIGCPVVDLPTVPEVIATVVAIHDQADCETGCEVIIARGVAVLPAGGDVCYGCGSIFTRPNGQLHPSLDVISEAVVARNQMKGN